MDKPPPMLGTRRWFGELLTWFVPTAGSAPAEGFIRRGIAWLLFLNLASIVVASLFICSWIPTWICFVTTLLFWGAGLAMLIDHFRKGSRTFPLFIAFLILLILTDILPPAGHIVARPFKIPTGAMQPTFNGVSGYPSTGPTPNFLHRCADLLLRGRHYIDVVSNVDDQIVQIEATRPGHSQIIGNPQTFSVAAGPDVLRSSFEVYPGRSYHAGEVIVRGAIDTGDHIFVDKLIYKFRPPRQGDLVVFSTAGIAGIREDPLNGAPIYVKRIAGIPGDTLRIDPPLLYINGQVAEWEGFRRVMSAKDGYRGYARGRDYLASPGQEYRVPENSYFVLGDNSYNSYDSRYWGCVPANNIIGRVARVYFPLSRAGVPR